MHPWTATGGQQGGGAPVWAPARSFNYSVGLNYIRGMSRTVWRRMLCFCWAESLFLVYLKFLFYSFFFGSIWLSAIVQEAGFNAKQSERKELFWRVFIAKTKLLRKHGNPQSSLSVELNDRSKMHFIVIRFPLIKKKPVDKHKSCLKKKETNHFINQYSHYCINTTDLFYLNCFFVVVFAVKLQLRCSIHTKIDRNYLT